MKPRKFLVGISSCLLGAAVRYDGKHKRDEAISQFFSRYVEFVPICPEVGIGMSTPRPPIRLVTTHQGIRVQGVTDRHQDMTLALTHYAQQQATLCSRLCGYIFKSRSPSCGLDDVPVFAEDGARLPGLLRGSYAHALLKLWPSLPVCDENRLQTALGRKQFLSEMTAYDHQRYQD